MVNDHFPMIFHHKMVHVWTNPRVLDGASSMQHPIPSCHQRLACFAKARATTGGPHRFGKHHKWPRKVVKPEVSIIDLLFNWNWNVPNTMESNINPSFFSIFVVHLVTLLSWSLRVLVILQICVITLVLPGVGGGRSSIIPGGHMARLWHTMIFMVKVAKDHYLADDSDCPSRTSFLNAFDLM